MCPDNLRDGRILSGIGPPRIFPPFPFPRFVTLFFVIRDWLVAYFAARSRFVNASPSPPSSRHGERRPTTKFVLHELTLFSSFTFFSSFIFLPFFSSLLVSLLSFYFFQNGKIGGGLRRERSPITVSLGNAQIRKALASRRISCKDFRITAPPPGRQDFRGSPSQKLTSRSSGKGDAPL